MNSLEFSSHTLDYKKTLIGLASDLQRLQEFSKKLRLNSLISRLDILLQRLEEDSFSVAVVGEFNRGKSTFVNAFLGRDILPSDILATTATLTRITHRLTPGAKICFKDGSDREIPLEQLSDYITKLTVESEAIAAQIKEATVYYPLPVSQNNHVEIVDTPGLNDDPEMTGITVATLQQCEAAIMVISAQSPFGISEEEFLTEKLLENGIDRILFVVNQIDLFNSPRDADRVVNLVKERIQNCIRQYADRQLDPDAYLKRIGQPKVFGISAFQALQARQTNNMSLLGKSCFVNFEYALKTTIDRERGLIRLRITSDRVLSCTRSIIDRVILQENLLALEQEKLRQAREDISQQIDNIRRNRVESINSIDTTLTGIKKQAETLSRELEDKLEATAKKFIQSTTIDASEFNQDPQAFQRYLSSQVGSELQTASSNLAQKIQQETYQGLSLAWSNMENFAELLDRAIPQLSLEMSQLGVDTTAYRKAIAIVDSVKRACDAFNEQRPISLALKFPNNSEIFVFEHEASGAGTLTGAAIGGFLFGPIGAGVGALIGSAVGGSMRADKFKEKYEPQVIAKIKEQVKIMNVDRSVNNYIAQASSQLEELQMLLIKAVASCLDKTENQLAEVYGQRQVTIAAKQQELRQVRAEVQTIVENTQKLSYQLSELSV